MAEIRIDLSELRSGWMLVNVRIGNDEIQAVASYIVDCLTDLVYAAIELLERWPVRPVVFFEEPDALRLSFTGDGEVIEVAATRHRELDDARRALKGTPLLVTSVERVALARAIWSALRRFEGAIGRAWIEGGWRNRFPVKEIAQLGAKLAHSRSSGPLRCRVVVRDRR